MKKCPFCGEDIRDEAIKCRYCGEFLEQPPEERGGAKKESVTKEAEKKEGPSSASLLLNFASFFFISMLLISIAHSYRSKDSFPYFSLTSIIVGVIIFLLLAKKLKQKRRDVSRLLAFSLSLILMGAVFLDSDYREYKNNRWMARAKKDAEIQHQEVLKYNREHKEEHYAEGLKLFKEKQYARARGVLDKVISVDPNYKDASKLINDINEEVARITHERQVKDAKEKISDAGRLMKSNKCGEIAAAISYSEQALKVLPDSQLAKKYLLQAKLEFLKCFMGNKNIKMAIRIRGYKPLTLYVWIKNDSSKKRYTNPNHFTLVTVNNVSYSVSSKTYGLTSHFESVDLQPGTETGGYLVFDTWDKPKKLVYEEFLSSTISREFPFKD